MIAAFVQYQDWLHPLLVMGVFALGQTLEGTVLTLEGSGTDARAQINFPRHGVKWLALSVAKLTPF